MTQLFIGNYVKYWFCRKCLDVLRISTQVFQLGKYFKTLLELCVYVFNTATRNLYVVSRKRNIACDNRNLDTHGKMCVLYISKNIL